MGRSIRCLLCGQTRPAPAGPSLAVQASELEARARAAGLPWSPADGHRRLFDLMPYYALPQREFAGLRRYLGVGR